MAIWKSIHLRFHTGCPTSSARFFNNIIKRRQNCNCLSNIKKKCFAFEIWSSNSKYFNTKFQNCKKIRASIFTVLSLSCLIYKNGYFWISLNMSSLVYLPSAVGGRGLSIWDTLYHWTSELEPLTEERDFVTVCPALKKKSFRRHWSCLNIPSHFRAKQGKERWFKMINKM
jgi:hypothetical protein